MTLVLTELSPFGIAMAADTAVTAIVPATEFVYAQANAAIKLQVIDYLNAGISCWGMGEIAGRPTDAWLAAFIKQNNDVPSLSEFANRLSEQLNVDIGVNQNGENRIGFHLAGYVDFDGQRVPSFYHVHDGPSTTLAERGERIDPHRINANHDVPPDRFLDLARKGQAWITRNGDYQLYAQIFQKLEDFFGSLRPLGISIPASQDASDRAEYLVFQIRTVARLYSLSNLIPGIGGGINYLAITSEGIYEHGIRYI